MAGPTGAGRQPKSNIVVGQKVDQAQVRRARELRRQKTMAERILWQRLRCNRLHGLHFRRQQIIHGFIVDFYCHEAGLVVEVAGEVHRQQAELDAERDQTLSALVLRVPNEEVMRDLPRALARIAQHAGVT